MRTRLLFAVFVALSIRVPGAAQDEKLKEIKGTLRQFDAKTGALSLKLLYSENLQSFSLAAKDLPVTDALGGKLTLNDVREDLRVSARIRGEDEIVALKIDGPYVYGMVKKVELASRRVTFKDPFGEKTVTIPASAKVMIKDVEAPLDVFKPGDSIQLLYSLDKKTILQAYAGKGVHSRDPFLRITRYYGIIADLDHEKRQVQMFVQNTDAGLIKTYEVSPDAYLRLQYHLRPIGEVGFDQFAKWVKAYYFVDRDTGKIVNMDADLPVMLRRKVVKIDAQNITVENELKEKALPLDARVQVLTPRGEGKLSEVAAGRIVNCGLSLDRNRVLVVYLWDR